MPFNPCGAICDYIDAPYTTKFRPFSDSDLEVDIVWYPARADAPVLPYPSVIQSRTNFPDESWAIETPGEVYDAPRIRNGERVKIGARGTHVCGSAADFAGLAKYNADLPPVLYDADGLPLCCGAAQPGRGGAVAGGASSAEYIPPGDVPPGTSCADAGVVELDTDYTWNADGRVLATWVWDTAPTAAVYHVACVFDGFHGHMEFGAGSDCAHMGFLGTLVSSGCVATVGVFSKLLIQVTFSSVGGTFQFRVSAGACP